MRAEIQYMVALVKEAGARVHDFEVRYTLSDFYGESYEVRLTLKRDGNIGSSDMIAPGGTDEGELLKGLFHRAYKALQNAEQQEELQRRLRSMSAGGEDAS